MKSILDNLKTLGYTITTTLLFLKNKFAVFLLQFLLMTTYSRLPTNTPIQFAELLYTVILALGIVLVALWVRLLVWPEVAAYAEKGYLENDLNSDHRTLTFTHYWRATGLSFLISISCFATLTH